jgi:hypothetical protein
MPPLMQEMRQKHEAIVRVLKARFNNLSAEELNKLAWEILEATLPDGERY